MALRGIAQANSIALPTQTFSALPSAASAPTRQPFFVSDVGTNGSFWYSTGTKWCPVNGNINLYLDTYSFIVPSSGSVASNGVITLTTALDITYANAFVYFPAGVYTGSAAGFYYCTFSSTTAGQMYTNTYTSGIPATPASPTAVSTGAGAYTQTTAADLAGQTFTIKGGIMDATSKVMIEQSVTTAATAGTKTLKFNYAGNSLGQTTSASAGANFYIGDIINTNSVSAQTTYSYNTGVINANNRTTNSGTDQTIAAVYKLATATDWIVSRSIFITLQE